MEQIPAPLLPQRNRLGTVHSSTLRIRQRRYLRRELCCSTQWWKKLQVQAGAPENRYKAPLPLLINLFDSLCGLGIKPEFLSRRCALPSNEHGMQDHRFRWRVPPWGAGDTPIGPETPPPAGRDPSRGEGLPSPPSACGERGPPPAPPLRSAPPLPAGPRGRRPGLGPREAALRA